MSEIEQRTQAWYLARAGHITASRIKDVMTRPRSKGEKFSIAQESYMGQLVCERLTKKPMESDEERERKSRFYDIERGERLESVARSEYELARSVTVDAAGFVKHPTMEWAGCSPDGYIGTDGMAQFKAPRRHIHLKWMENGVVPAEHIDQMLFELDCHPGRKWSDFVSYIDDMEELPHLKLFIVRLYPDPNRMEEIRTAVAALSAEVDRKISRLPGPDGKTNLERELEASLRNVNQASPLTPSLAS